MKRERGHGLLLALVVLVIMMTALGLVAGAMAMGMQEVRREVRTVSLVALTDAAMAETLAHLAADDRFDGIDEYRFGRGLISSEVRALGQKRVEIVARATYGGRDRAVRAEVLLPIGGPQVLRWHRTR